MTCSNFDKPSLNACLIQCADQGAKAFGTSAKSFDAISLKSNTVKITVCVTCICYREEAATDSEVEFLG